MLLLLKNLLFTLVVPGTVAVYVPLSIAGDRLVAPGPTLAYVTNGLGLDATQDDHGVVVIGH